MPISFDEPMYANDYLVQCDMCGCRSYCNVSEDIPYHGFFIPLGTCNQCGETGYLSICEFPEDVIDIGYDNCEDEVEIPRMYIYTDSEGLMFPSNDPPTDDDLELVKTGDLSICIVHDNKMFQLLLDDGDKLKIFQIEMGRRIVSEVTGEVATFNKDEADRYTAGRGWSEISYEPELNDICPGE